MASPGRLHFVSHRAPVEAHRTPQGLRVSAAIGGLAGALERAVQATGVGCTAWAASSRETPPADAAALPFALRSVRVKDRATFYAGFANQVLWPLCHTAPDRCRPSASSWAAFRRVNESFATALHEEIRPGDLVWVNDFHLALVPGQLRSAGCPARVGVYWHIPFPPPLLFGVCPWRVDVIAGLLGADVVGFQTDEDVHGFLACVRRFLGLPVAEAPLRVRLPGRDVRVVALPVGIDAARLKGQAADAAVTERASRLREALGAESVILGVDRLDYAKGIPERLLGFERFLEGHPEWQRRVSLVQITAPPPFRVGDYRELKRTIEEIVGRILGRFSHDGRAPLAYLYTAFDHEHLAAYYRAANVALVTPLRDGMGLVAKEYVACHSDGEAVLVLSEFAGAAHELGDALMVNPYDPESIRRGLVTAVGMAPDERRRRMRTLGASVAAHDVHWWTAAFLELLRGDEAIEAERAAAQASPSPASKARSSSSSTT